MPFRFIGSIGTKIIATYVLVTALICGIYLIEQFVPLLETALRYAFGGLAFGKLLVLTLPRIIEFALPLASLCVAYFAILEARERRELLVMSASGASSSHLAVTMLLAGAVAGAISLGISGFVKPAASFAYRSTLRESVNQVLSKEVPVGAFYDQSDSVLYSRASETGPLRVMRLFEFDGERLRQIVMSNCSRMRVEDGVVIARTCDLKGYRFGNPTRDKPQPASLTTGEPCTICLNDEGKIAVTGLLAGQSGFSFPMGDVFTSPVRNRASETNLPDLLAARQDRFVSEGFATLAAIKILSAICCVIGIMLALVAVAFTTFRTRVAALPVACAAMMLLMVLVNSQSWAFYVEAGRTALLLKLGAVAAACIPAAWLVAKLTYGRLIAPALAKP